MSMALCTVVVLLAWLWSLFGARVPDNWRWPLALLLAVAMLLPWPWGVAHWLPAYLGQFSVVTVLLALDRLGRWFGPGGWLQDREVRKLAWLLPAVAVWFFPLSLGVTALDPYALGFGDFRLSTALLLLGLYFWIGRDYGLCLLLVAAQVAWRLELLPSDNLWDYLLDPWLVIWSLVWLARRERVVSPAA